VQIAKLTVANPTIYRSILGISWFWAMGSAILILFPHYTSHVLSASPTIATLFLALFSIGIGAGSMLCERLSRDGLELGLVPIGAVGLTLFTLDLFFIGVPWPAPADGSMVGVSEFLTHITGARIAFDLFLVAVSGGFFIVPLYTLIQLRAPADQRSRIIAGNNIVNSAFMVGVAGILAVTGFLGVSEPTMFGFLALANLLVAIYIFTLIPEFLLRFLAFVLSNLMYRLEVSGLDNVPSDGPAVLVCNHVSFIDWLIVGGAIKRPSRFVMHKSFFEIPIAKTLFKAAKVIPICSEKEDPEILAAALDKIAEELEAGWTVALFPEGAITDDGEIHAFRQGVERMIERTPAPVVPMALNGLWGSYFSRIEGAAMKHPLRRGAMSKLWLTIDPPVPPEEATADGLHDAVEAIWRRRSEK
jgi:1-acyl-sn-glycerol-3-phosphate acyltransferase